MAQTPEYTSKVGINPERSVFTPYKEASPMATGARPDMAALAKFGNTISDEANDIQRLILQQDFTQNSVLAEKEINDFLIQQETRRTEWENENRGEKSLDPTTLKEEAEYLKTAKAEFLGSTKVTNQGVKNAMLRTMDAWQLAEYRKSNNYVQTQMVHTAAENLQNNLATRISNIQSGKETPEEALILFENKMDILRSQVPISQSTIIAGVARIENAGKATIARVRRETYADYVMDEAQGNYQVAILRLDDADYRQTIGMTFEEAQHIKATLSQSNTISENTRIHTQLARDKEIGEVYFNYIMKKDVKGAERYLADKVATKEIDATYAFSIRSKAIDQINQENSNARSVRNDIEKRSVDNAITKAESYLQKNVKQGTQGDATSTLRDYIYEFKLTNPVEIQAAAVLISKQPAYNKTPGNKGSLKDALAVKDDKTPKQEVIPNVVGQLYRNKQGDIVKYNSVTKTWDIVK